MCVYARARVYTHSMKTLYAFTLCNHYYVNWWCYLPVLPVKTALREQLLSISCPASRPQTSHLDCDLVGFSNSREKKIEPGLVHFHFICLEIQRRPAVAEKVQNNVVDVVFFLLLLLLLIFYSYFFFFFFNFLSLVVEKVKWGKWMCEKRHCLQDAIFFWLMVNWKRGRMAGRTGFLHQSLRVLFSNDF